MKVVDVDALNEKLERLAIQRIKGDDGYDVLTVSLADVLRMIDSLSTIELETTFADRMSRKLDALGLPVREYNCLRRYGIDTIAELYRVQQDGMLPKVRNLGRKSMERVEKALDEFIRVKQLPSAELSTNLAEVGTDCISRQQAINALERAKQNIHHNIERAIGDAICEILDEVENGIKQLPPIHPVNNSEMPNGSDVISRQAAIDVIGEVHPLDYNAQAIKSRIESLPSAQPDIIRCRNCKFASGDSRICMKFDHSPIGELDFCSFAERREVTT